MARAGSPAAGAGIRIHVVTGDYPHPLPVILGHEAAGVVEKIGPGVETVKVGDHVCSSYIPSCGRCWYCISGQPTMCALRDKPRWFMLDGTPRFRKNGRGLHHFLQVAGYATHAVLPELSDPRLQDSAATSSSRQIAVTVQESGMSVTAPPRSCRPPTQRRAGTRSNGLRGIQPER